MVRKLFLNIKSTSVNIYRNRITIEYIRGKERRPIDLHNAGTCHRHDEGRSEGGCDL